MKNEYVEMTPELIAACDAADRRVNELYEQLRQAEAAKQKILDNAVASIAEFKVGEEVAQGSGRYRIERIRGESFGITGSTPKVWLRYEGSKLKKDGSTFGSRRRLYDPQSITPKGEKSS